MDGGIKIVQPIWNEFLEHHLDSIFEKQNSLNQ